ncbi:MAG: hypothetical protein L6461_14300 [Anaerolineae bacterium]|nr:hypothetical protein [Anaerolineae bacterium]
MKKRLALFTSLCVIAIGLACLTPTPAPPATPNPDEIATIVAATLTAQAPLPPGATEPPPAETPPPTEPPPPACLPLHPGAQSLSLPAAIAAGNADTIALYNFQGGAIALRPVTGISWMSENQVHLAGSLSQGVNNLPIVYYSLQNGGTLKSNVNNVITGLASAPNLMAIKGAEGNPYLSFDSIDMMAGSVNQVYAGSLAELPAMQPRMTWIPPQQGGPGNAIQPLAVRYDAGQAHGVWFTYTMYGIGNINFPPYRGLTYLDLSSNQTTEFIAPTLALGGMSPDQTLVASASGAGGSPWITNGFSIRNLVTCQETTISLNPGSNLGAGYVVFSPDNQFVAWLEASGPSNMEAGFRLRVARTDGTSVFDAPAANLSGLLGGEAVTFPRPLGWASNHLLLLEIYSQTLNQSVLVLWAPDPAQPLDPVLGANQSAPIADGTFLGFVYS